jgi:hypothetical protein
MRVLFGVIAVVAVLAALRFKPWQRPAADQRREKLTVGFLPVT